MVIRVVGVGVNGGVMVCERRVIELACGQGVRDCRCHRSQIIPGLCGAGATIETNESDRGRIARSSWFGAGTFEKTDNRARNRNACSCWGQSSWVDRGQWAGRVMDG